MDEQVVRRDKTVKQLSEKFESVRLVKCNDLDLSLFQFDYDLTFAVFFLNADRTIYARYGVRTSMDADKDVALEGLAATMKQVLQLHEKYPTNKEQLAGKQPLPTDISKPSGYPHLEHFKPSLDYDGKVAKSCIHCHQVREARRLVYRNALKPLPEKLMFPYPDPKLLGIEFVKESSSTIRAVASNSPAQDAGIANGDVLHSIEGSTIASESDVFWMLHNLDQESKLDMVMMRDGMPVEISMLLPENWRKKSDIAWRPTSWEFRRMATGGLSLKPITDTARLRLNIEDAKMALEATHVGKFGQHARARRAGIRKGDVIVSFDGKNDLLSETAINEYAVQRKKPGDKVVIKYLRNGKPKSASIILQ